jgi:ABC-type dipeptide/oligopeptide/nickel transport system ATPase component
MAPTYYSGMKAIYLPRESPGDIPNPFYEALPPALSFKETLAALADPSNFFDKRWREMRPEKRLGRLTYMQEFFFVPRPCHAHLVSAVRQILYCSYTSRGDVFTPGYFATDLDDFLDLIDRENRYSRNLGLFGDAGSGKSLAMLRAIGQIPKIICHTNYEGKELIMDQAPIVVVICPKSGDLALCRAILRAISKHLKSPYKNPKSSEEGEAMIAAKVRAGAIGLIVLDEYDAIFKGSKVDDTLQMLTRLNEEAGIPFMKLGTRFAFGRVKNVPHTARRSAGYGPWRKMDKNEEWEAWLESVLKFHLTDKPLVYSAEMSGIFYEYSQGLAEAVIGLFVTTQKRALLEERKEVLPKDFKGVDEGEMFTMTPTLLKYRRLAAKNQAKTPETSTPKTPSVPQDPGMDVGKITGESSPSPEPPREDPPTPEA